MKIFKEYGSKERLFEMMQKVNKSNLNESSCESFDNEIEKSQQLQLGVSESTDQDKYEDVVFLKDSEAEKALEILNAQGKDAALEYLKQWHDIGNHMGRNELPHGRSDNTYEKDGYHMSWNNGLGYIGLTYDLSGLGNEVSEESHYDYAGEERNYWDKQYHNDAVRQVGDVKFNYDNKGNYIPSGYEDKKVALRVVKQMGGQEVTHIIRFTDEDDFDFLEVGLSWDEAKEEIKKYLI